MKALMPSRDPRVGQCPCLSPLRLALLVLLAGAPAADAAGDRDPGFGAGGIVTTAIGSSSEGAAALVVQPDGRPVVAGSVQQGDTQAFALVRYGPDGSLDATFGTGGKVTTAIGTTRDAAFALAAQPDGKLVAAGHSTIGSDGNRDFALVRYNPDGSLDATFGTGGKVTTAIGTSHESALAIAVEPDGRIVAAGFVRDDSGATRFALVRYNADGALDPSFGAGGKVTTGFGARRDRALALVRQPDGKLVAAGGADNGSNQDFALVRYNPDGALDPSFGAGGKVTTGIGAGDEEAYGIVVQPDGKLVAAGRSANGGRDDFALVRYHPDGSLDVTFGVGGRSTAPLGPNSYRAFALALQSDGKLVAAGTSNADGNDDFALARYDADGSLDPTFGAGGSVTTAVGSGSDAANALAIQRDGRLVAAGSSFNGENSDIAVVRYLGDAAPPAVVPVATIVQPAGQPMKRRRLRGLSGTAGPIGQVAMVEIALQRISPKLLARKGRCRWMKSAEAAFIKLEAVGGRCGAPHFLPAIGTASWTFDLERRLPKGTYELLVRVTLTSGTHHTTFDAAEGNLRSFRVR